MHSVAMSWAINIIISIFWIVCVLLEKCCWQRGVLWVGWPLLMLLCCKALLLKIWLKFVTKFVLLRKIQFCSTKITFQHINGVYLPEDKLYLVIKFTISFSLMQISNIIRTKILINTCGGYDTISICLYIYFQPYIHIQSCLPLNIHIVSFHLLHDI